MFNRKSESPFRESLQRVHQINGYLKKEKKRLCSPKKFFRKFFSAANQV